nr:hypothetical protein [Faecalibaculum rodentium]
MTFNGFPYTRPDLADLQAQLDRILQSLQQAGDAPAFLEILHEYDDLKSHFMTLAELAGHPPYPGYQGSVLYRGE